jgi:hypothetical protein
LGKFRVVTRRLTAETDLAPHRLRRGDDTGDHGFDRRGTLIKEVRHNGGVAIDAQHELR